MASKRLKWLKYLFINAPEGTDEQNYHLEKRRKHYRYEHSDGVVYGLDVTQTVTPSLRVRVAPGRALTPNGNDPELESLEEVDLGALIPGAGTVTAYVTIRFEEVETEPYWVEELGTYQNGRIQDTRVLEAALAPPVGDRVEVCRVLLAAGTTAITDPVDPEHPTTNEIDSTHVRHTGKEVTNLRDLADVSDDEADAFNAMASPSATNRIVVKDELDAHVDRTDNPHATTAAQLSDLDTEVSASPDVVANTAARHSHGNKSQLDLVTDGDHDARTDNPHVVTKGQVGLGDVENVRVHSATVDPTVYADGNNGYALGSHWLNRSSGVMFACIDNAPGAAVWVADPQSRRQNTLANGNFDVWQRGTTFNDCSGGRFTADRWLAFDNLSTGVLAVSRQTAGPTVDGVACRKYNWVLQAVAALFQSSIGSSELSYLRYAVEGRDFKPLVLGWGTLSFWARAGMGTGTMCVAFQNYGHDRTYVVEVPLTSTWTRFVLRVPFTETAGAWNYTNGAGLYIYFVLAAGSDFRSAPPDTWVATDDLATPNQSNFMGSGLGALWLAQVQLDLGRVAIPFHEQDHATELARCQRYYEKSYDLDYYAGSSTALGVETMNSYEEQAYGEITVHFTTRKRSDPTVLIYAYQTGTEGNVRDVSLNADRVASVSNPSEKSFVVSSTAVVSDRRNWFHWVADAEL